MHGITAGIFDGKLCHTVIRIGIARVGVGNCHNPATGVVLYEKRSGWNFGLPNYRKLVHIYRTHFVSHIDLERQSDRCAPTLDSSTIIISAPRSNLRSPSGFQAGKWHASKFENEILSGRSSLEAIACDNGKEQDLRTCAFHLHLMHARGFPHLVGTSPTTTELSEILL